jgi:hypothetical protein
LKAALLKFGPDQPLMFTTSWFARGDSRAFTPNSTGIDRAEDSIRRWLHASRRVDPTFLCPRIDHPDVAHVEAQLVVETPTRRAFDLSLRESQSPGPAAFERSALSASGQPSRKRREFGTVLPTLVLAVRERRVVPLFSPGAKLEDDLTLQVTMIQFA